MQYVERAPLMTKYFGNYKLGAYWIYYNRDSTKKDSIWAESFKTIHTGDAQFSCQEGDEIQFYLRNEHLEPTHKLQINIKFNGQDLSRTIFEALGTNGGLFTFFYATANGTKFLFNNEELPMVNSYNIWHSDTNYTFNEVAQVGNLFFAPNIGLIQFIPTNSTDTFSLTKFVQ